MLVIDFDGGFIKEMNSRMDQRGVTPVVLLLGRQRKVEFPAISLIRILLLDQHIIVLYLVLRRNYALFIHKTDSFLRFRGKQSPPPRTPTAVALRLVRRPRAIILGGMDNPRLTSEDLAELSDNKHSVVQFSLELEEREATGQVPIDDVAQEIEPKSVQVVNPSADDDSVDKDKTAVEFDGRDAMDGNRLRVDRFCFSRPPSDAMDGNRLRVRRGDRFRTGTPPAEFLFFIPANHQRPWTPPVGYTCVYQSWFNDCSLWWPLPEFLTTYCSRRKIALGQYTSNGIRILVTLSVLVSELGIKMSVRLFEEITTPSITSKTWFFYGKMFPKYNVITGKPSKVNFWNRAYFYFKINEASFEDPSVIFNGYFNANIDCLSKWSQGGSQSFLEEVESIRTLTHQHWPDIGEARIQAALNRINRAESRISSSGGSRPAKRRRASNVDEGALHVSPSRSPPSERPKEDLSDDSQNQETSLEEKPSLEPIVEAEAVTTTEVPTEEHLVDPSMEEETQGDQFQEPEPVTHGDEVVEYPHVIDFRYQHTDVPFVEDHEAPARLFRQMKLKKKGMPELEQLSQYSRYREMTRARAIVSILHIRVLLLLIILLSFFSFFFHFFGNANLMVRDYEAKLKAQDEKLALKTGSLKRKRKEIVELAYKCGTYEEQFVNLKAEKNEAVERAELERSRNELLSRETLG
ncbi:hypothetical protein N665_1407s0002 [Sinapis alba]|nr:hypothetical protein N665_1407s0002 [Sinapis alba]